MKDQLIEQGEKFLLSLTQLLQQGLDKAPTYVLDLLPRFQRYKGIQIVVCLFVSLILIVVGIKMLPLAAKNETEEGVFASIAAIIVGLVMFIISATFLLKIIFIPEIYFVKWLSH